MKNSSVIAFSCLAALATVVLVCQDLSSSCLQDGIAAPSVATDIAPLHRSDISRKIVNDYGRLVKQVEVNLCRIQDVGPSGHHQPYRVTGKSVVTKGDWEFPEGRDFRLSERLTAEEDDWIYVAGEVRAKGCVELLLNRISKLHLPPPRPISPPYRLHRPAFDALVKIGEPACGATIDRLRVEDNPENRLLMTELLTICPGNAEARLELEKARDRQPRDSDEWRNLDQAVEMASSQIGIEEALKALRK
ncbi:hypothetical protein [Planctopirus hydrillae]|uniref:hypothetical protein n=1 Tax=Planctopirus hydrillae TaxID=1841610 RepID=UPI001041FF54|nr:hypothetical protein [Planctopirus hydrillae]